MKLFIAPTTDLDIILAEYEKLDNTVTREDDFWYEIIDEYSD